MDEDGAADALTWYADTDGDGFGDPSTTDSACAAPSGYVSDATDCDDTDSAVNPAATEVCDGVDNDCDSTIDEDDASDALAWYADSDGDSFGDAGSTTPACTEPSGYVGNATDCDDTDSAVNPAATEVCDGVDNDCDSTVDEDDASDALTWYADSDGDSFGDAGSTTPACTEPSGYISDATDCDDSDSAVNPDAEELCDGVDNDCDSTIDEDDASDALTWYADDDGDSYGDPSSTTAACAEPSGYVSDGTDCDDTDANIYPGAEETSLDGVDSDCDGEDDVDVDGDGFASWDSGGTDCDDTDSTTNPGAVELADGIDNDCDGDVDEGTAYVDSDGDGYAPAGGDCDDANAAVHPSAVETADGVDEDCDGIIDEGTEVCDDDGDGYTEDSGDCNDADPAVYPGATEDLANGTDDDCDGVVDSGEFDEDSDGYLPGAGDCDDTDAAAYPGAPELADGVDNDCDGIVDEGTEVYDDDGDGYTELEGDCDDANADSYPGGDEVLDGVDNNCDSIVDEGTEVYDDDSDGYTELEGDCDDADPDTHPGALEQADGLDNDCDTFVDEGTSPDDTDGDGYTVDDGDCDDTDGWSHSGADELCDGVDNDCDDLVDEDDVCSLDGADEVGSDSGGKSGCATVGNNSSAVLWLLAGGVLFWRRRRDGLAGAVVAGASVGCVENGLRAVQPVLETDSRADLGEVLAGGEVEVNLSLRSVGSGDVKISDSYFDEEVGGEDVFSLDDGWPIALDAESEDTLTVTYRPRALGWDRAKLWVVSDSVLAPLPVELVARAVDPQVGLWPPRLDFGPVGAGEEATLEVTLFNDGTLPLTITDLSVAAPFALVEPDSAVLQPGTERALAVRFSPDSDDPAAATLDVRFAEVGVLDAELLGNDCEQGEPALFDADGDGVTTCAGDCNDRDAEIRPGAVELPDGLDNDCDALADEGTTRSDDDGDGLSEDDGDCDDANAAVSPGAAEVEGNGIDDDCDGTVDDGQPDQDGDGYAVLGGDCDDTNASVRPGAPELADGIDNDCDGIIDEGTASADDDGDGFSEDGGDCDDTNAAAYPGAAEAADWLDNDCDGVIDEGTVNVDDDGDGFAEIGGDCDDTSDAISPGHPEVTGDGLDNDCDGIVE